jgi:FlaA1/EpsC-like NDP-sugar epimerase
MKYLVTGGSGFLGNELIKRLDGDIRVLARNEASLVALKEKFPHIEIMVGDVADPYVCDRALKDIDGVYHLAAMKHVGLSEQNVAQTIQTNIPIALLEATRKNKPKFIIGISTDKAASRSGVYGATKFLMERLFSEYARANPETKYRTVRYGNVLYSSGSVLCKWKDRILAGQEIIITDPDATRFFWTVEQAVDLIFETLEKAPDAKPYSCSMKSIRMGDLMNAMIEKYAGMNHIRVSTIGLQPGESVHEVINEGHSDSSQVEKFTKEEIMELI